jgi:hypothetical protein
MSANPRYRNTRRQTTFGRVVKNDWQTYSDRKAAWIKANPQASSREIDQAARQIAKELGL